MSVRIATAWQAMGRDPLPVSDAAVRSTVTGLDLPADVDGRGRVMAVLTHPGREHRYLWR